MATQLKFTKVVEKYVSDTITSIGKDIVVFIKLQEVGALQVQRSITGTNWSLPNGGNIRAFREDEIQLTGVVAEQKVRIVSDKPVSEAYYLT